MIAPALASGRLLLAAGLVALALTACGRRGALEPPPDPAAVAAQKQREEQRRQRQSGARPGAASAGGVTVGQTELQPLGQTSRLEGDNPPPEDDNDLPSILPSPAPSPATSAGGGRKRGYVIPKEPFILDPLL